MDINEVANAKADQLRLWFGELTPDEVRLIKAVTKACVRGERQTQVPLKKNHSNPLSKSRLYEKRFSELEGLCGRSLEVVMDEIPDDIEFKYAPARRLMVEKILKPNQE